MTEPQRVAVYGPTGYTGRQVLAELRRREISPVMVGRDAERLRAVEAGAGGEIRVASLEDSDALGAAFDGAAAVINCVGPFETSAGPVVSAALAVNAHYLDFTAEQAAVLALLERWDEAAKDRGVAIVPAMGFYGGLGDLLASVTADGFARPAEITVAYAVDGWLLTQGSRATAAVIAGRRWVWRDGQLEFITGKRRYGSFDYPPPRGTQAVMEDYPLPEALTVPRHIDVPSVRLVMAASTLREVSAPDAPAPEQVSDEERARSRFTVVAAVTDGASERQTVAVGSDIYGITAPMIVAAAISLSTSSRAGVLAPSQAVNAGDFLVGLQAHGVGLEPADRRGLAN